MTTFYGTTGVDVADAEAVMPQLVGFTGGTLTDLLDSLADVFNGGNGQDTIKARVNVTSGHTLYGEGGADELYGGDGADFIDGGTGADYMEGGNGYDTYIIDDSGDVIYDTGSTSDAAYSSLASINLANFTGIELAYLTGALNLNVVGSTAGNIIYGNDGNNVIDGRQGDDSMLGGKGNDVYYVDSLLDEVYETASSQFGTQDTIITTVNVRLDTTTTAEGVEHVSVIGTAAVTVVGTAVFNVIAGNSGANYLAGYGGNDTVNGGVGNDTVFGGDGKDTLTGGTGDDKFLYSFVADSGGTQPRRDVITDFNQIAGNNDWIDLALADANGASAGNQAFVFIGTAAFSGAAGELRYFQDVANNRTIIEGNVRVDAASPGAEFSIELTGLKTLTAGASNAFDIIL